MNNKLGNSFIENFPILIQSVIKKILPQMSVEEKSLVNLFYWGHDYDVLRKDIDNDKIKDLKALINKLKDNAIKIYQHKATIPNHNTLKESTKTNITTNNPKKIANINIKNNNSLQKKIESGKLYEEKDQETVLKIIDRFKVTNPDYYEIISKKYSGDKFEIKNDVKLTQKEQIIFNSAKKRINLLLANKQKLIIFLAENLKFDITLENQEFKCKIDKNDLNLYISNLDKISNESAIEVINQIAKYYPNKIIDIINSNYIKNKLNYLTQKEQAYIYLNLLSYNIPSLTKKKISQILDVEELFLDEYQIMTSNDDVNELNKLIKK